MYFNIRLFSLVLRIKLQSYLDIEAGGDLKKDVLPFFKENKKKEHSLHFLWSKLLNFKRIR